CSSDLHTPEGADAPESAAVPSDHPRQQRCRRGGRVHPLVARRHPGDRLGAGPGHVQAGYDKVIDLSSESLVDGVVRLTGGRGVDVVLDGIAGPVTGPATASLARGGMLVSIGYSGGTQASIDVTDLIW